MFHGVEYNTQRKLMMSFINLIHFECLKSPILVYELF